MSAPVEVQYYCDVFFDLLNSWRSVHSKVSSLKVPDAALTEKKARIVVRLPRALQHLSDEIDRMPLELPEDRKSFAIWRCQLLLFGLVVEDITTGELRGITLDKLRTDNIVAAAQTKFEFVIEESSVLLKALDPSKATHCGDSALISAMKGNLVLRVEEFFDVAKKVEFQVAAIDDPGSLSDEHEARDEMLQCYFTYAQNIVQKIAQTCGVAVGTARTFNFHDMRRRATLKNGKSLDQSAATATKREEPALPAPQSACSVM